MLVRRYLKKDRIQDGKQEATEGEDLGSEEAGGEELTLDVDARVIQADKGDGEMAYDGTVGYHPMLGFLSDGRRRPCCSFVKFRPGKVVQGRPKQTCVVRISEDGRVVGSESKGRDHGGAPREGLPTVSVPRSDQNAILQKSRRKRQSSGPIY
jgi:hypothetical protein